MSGEHFLPSLAFCHRSCHLTPNWVPSKRRTGYPILNTSRDSLQAKCSFSWQYHL